MTQKQHIIQLRLFQGVNMLHFRCYFSKIKYICYICVISIIHYILIVWFYSVFIMQLGLVWFWTIFNEEGYLTFKSILHKAINIYLDQVWNDSQIRACNQHVLSNVDLSGNMIYRQRTDSVAEYNYKYFAFLYCFSFIPPILCTYVPTNTLINRWHRGGRGGRGCWSRWFRFNTR